MAPDYTQSLRDRVRFAPAEEWVTIRELDENWRPPVEAASSLVLLDCQYNATTGETYRRSALRMDAMAGMQENAQWHCDFDPATQEVVIHSLAVRRAGRILEHAAPGRLRIFQREQNLDRLCLDGTATLLVLLEDVRIGDIVDVSYTVKTVPRLFPGHFGFVTAIPTERYARAFHLSVRFKSDRRLRAYTDSAKIVRQDRRLAENETEWSWCVENFSPRPPEPAMPSWYFPGRFIQVSDFASWQEVALGFAAAWTDDFANEGLATAVRNLAEENATQCDAIEAALRLVQDDLRYLSVNTELGGHRPSPPGHVLQRRFGDCKDKAFLLVHLLRGLGVPARPVLVHSAFRKQVERFLPTASIFDHAIVEFELGGERRWVDATVPQQGGGPLGRSISAYGVGLPIGWDVTELQPIVCPASAAPSSELTDSLRAKAAKSSLSIKAVLRASGADADDYRRKLIFDGAASVAQLRDAIYSGFYPGATREGAMEWRDDRQRNEFILVDCYTVPKAFTRANEPGVYGIRLPAHTIQQALAFPDSDKRKHPLALLHSRAVTHHIICEFATVYGSGREFASVETREFRYEVRVHRQPGKDRYTYEYKTFADHVPADQYQYHRERVHEAFRSTALVIHVPADRSLGRRDHSDEPLLPALEEVPADSAIEPAFAGAEAKPFTAQEHAPVLSSPTVQQQEAIRKAATRKPSRVTSVPAEIQTSTSAAQTQRAIKILGSIALVGLFAIKLLIAVLAR